MQRIAFYIIYPILWFFSILPFWVLHILSDIIFVFLFHVFNYRKEIVLENLRFAFPHKTEKELKKIRKKFFRHFVDIFVEMIKSFSMSQKELNKRYKYVNKELFKEIEALNKSCILIGSHYANWEWIAGFKEVTNFDCYGVYSRIKNPYFDKFVRKNRSRFGGNFVQTSNTIKTIIRNKINKKLSVYGLLSDQSPIASKTTYWSEFLNVKVPIHTGAEMLAKKHDFSVVLLKTTRVKRSYYEVELEILAKNPKETAEHEITDLFLRKTEEQIYQNPEYYFWTHRRFKHKEKAPK